jgi:hypothetical protein
VLKALLGSPWVDRQKSGFYCTTSSWIWFHPCTKNKQRYQVQETQSSSGVVGHGSRRPTIHLTYLLLLADSSSLQRFLLSLCNPAPNSGVFVWTVPSFRSVPLFCSGLMNNALFGLSSAFTLGDFLFASALCLVSWTPPFLKNQVSELNFLFYIIRPETRPQELNKEPWLPQIWAKISHSKPMEAQQSILWQLKGNILSILHNYHIGHRVESMRFIMSPHWLRSDQWKPRYLRKRISGLPLVGSEQIGVLCTALEV